MNKKSIIPIVLTIDKLFIEYACVTIYSLVQNCTLDNDYTIYVFHNGLLEIMKNRLYSIIKNKNNIHLEFKDVTQFIEHHKLKSNLKHVTNATFYRYLIPIILNQYEKILYLDTDIVVITDIANLFNIPVSNLIDNKIKENEQKISKNYINLTIILVLIIIIILSIILLES